jgi:hypothetical protein
MMIQCLDLLLGSLACVVLHELVLIYVVLVLFMLTATKSFFVFSLFWLIKLILGLVNFVIVLTSQYINIYISLNVVVYDNDLEYMWS